MTVRKTSASGGFEVEAAPKFQISDGPNTGIAAIESGLVLWVPDPQGRFGAGSELITGGGGSSGLWNVTISPVNGGVIGAPVFTAAYPNLTNFTLVELDPAVFSANRLYRVQLTDDGANLIDEWDFTTFELDISASSADVATINNKLRRAQALLSKDRIVRTTVKRLGQPLKQVVEILDPATRQVVASYGVSREMVQSGEVDAEVCYASDGVVL